jgi:hypothetical protein
MVIFVLVIHTTLVYLLLLDVHIFLALFFVRFGHFLYRSLSYFWSFLQKFPCMLLQDLWTYDYRRANFHLVDSLLLMFSKLFVNQHTIVPVLIAIMMVLMVERLGDLLPA